jgi:hypothetical protein
MNLFADFYAIIEFQHEAVATFERANQKFTPWGYRAIPK